MPTLQQIVGCDNRIQGPTATTRGISPWQHVARLQLTGAGSGTGTLVAPRHVLTAAHVVLKRGQRRGLGSASLEVRLGQFSDRCGWPYGAHYATRLFVPTDYDNRDICQRNKALDYAIVELAEPIAGAVPMAFEYISWPRVRDRTPFSVGYPNAKGTGTVWQTGSSNRFLDNPFLWLGGGERGLHHVTNDASAGQSGSPVYVFQDGIRKIVGVLLGSPVVECRQGRLWAARLTPGAVSRIRSVIDGNPDSTLSVLEYADTPETEDPCPLPLSASRAGSAYPPSQ